MTPEDGFSHQRTENALFSRINKFEQQIKNRISNLQLYTKQNTVTQNINTKSYQQLIADYLVKKQKKCILSNITVKHQTNLLFKSIVCKLTSKIII